MEELAQTGLKGIESLTKYRNVNPFTFQKTKEIELHYRISIGNGFFLKKVFH